MDSNTHSTDDSVGRPGRLAALTAAVDDLADLDGLADTVQAEQVLELRRLVDRLEGQWLKDLAGVDARGAAGADQGQEFGSTAGWLRNRLHLSDRAASRACPDRPGPVPRPADRNRPGRVRWGAVGRPRPSARPGHPDLA